MLASAWLLPNSSTFRSGLVRLSATVYTWLPVAILPRAAHCGTVGPKQGLSKRLADNQAPGVTVRSVVTQQGATQLYRGSAATSTASQQHREQPAVQRSRQQQGQSDEGSLPGSRLIAAQDDRVSYQGRVGGTVTLPRKDSPLWQAAFYGNVPTQWWLDRSSSSCNPAAASAACAITDAQQGSNSSMANISSWSDLVAQSAYIQQAFCLAGPLSPLLHWQQGRLLPGRQAFLGSYRSHSPCPRASLNRLARVNMQGRILSLRQVACSEALPAAWFHKAYMHSRWRWSRSRTQRLLQQQQQRCPGSSLPACSLRSHKGVAARYIRNKWRGWQPAGTATGPLLPIIPCLDTVPRICSEDSYDDAQQFAATVGIATRCVAERDEQGRLLPLPEGCTGAGCYSMRSSAGRCSSSDIEQQQQQQQAEGPTCMGGPQSSMTQSKCLLGSGGNAAEPRGRNRPLLATSAAPASVASVRPQEGGFGSSSPAAPAEQMTQEHSQSLQTVQAASCRRQDAEYPTNVADQPDQQVLELPSSAVQALGFNAQQLDAALRQARIVVTAAGHESSGGTEDFVAHSDSDWESDDDSDVDYDESDFACITDDELLDLDLKGFFDGLGLPADLRAAIYEPHVFRNSSNIIYGFWSKCPLG